MKNKVLLVNPVFPRKVAGVPLQTLYLASALKNASIETRILDLNIVPEQEQDTYLEDTLNSFKPTYVGVTSYSPNHPESLHIMRRTKEVSPDTIVISGGPHDIALGKDSPKPEFVDHRVTDTFGENALLEIVGSERRVADRQELFPAYELIPQHPSYQFDNELFEGRNMTQILTATGCNQKCDFCSAQQNYIPFRNDVVVEHLEKLTDLGFDAVFFNDPNFTNPYRSPLLQAQGLNDRYGRVRSLMEALITSGLSEDLVWGCQTKASMVNAELLDLMADAGCRYITYALENVDDASLREMRKGITPEMVNQAIHMTKGAGMKTGLYVMFGTKEDKEEDFENARATLDYVEKLRPEFLSISILANYPMLDRNKSGERKHMGLDYTNKRYSREPIWLEFDEGWGAYHPNCDVEQARRYKEEIDRRIETKPQVWNRIRRF